MKRFIFSIILLAFLFSGCYGDHDKYDGLIIMDKGTGKTYRLRHNTGDSYYIDEKIIKINGRDTSIVFE